MANSAILYPVLALIGWTLLILMLVPLVRVRAAMRQQVTADDFRYGESPSVPPQLGLPNRNYMNLLELPILFYVVCLVAYSTGSVTAITVALAWCFVALRIMHSAIHLSYNNVLHRLAVFAIGAAVLALQLVATGLALRAN